MPALGRAVSFIPGLRSSSEPMVGYRGGNTSSDSGVAREEGWGQGDLLTICVGSSGRGGGVLLVPG